MNPQELPGGAAASIPATSYGATLVSPGLTCFRLWAPNATRVDVVIDGGAQIEAMQQLSGGWFDAFVQCGAGARYLFRLDGEIAMQEGEHGSTVGFWHVPRRYNAVADALAKRGAQRGAAGGR